MPKLIDYAGRFAFFEEASFAIVRDHGVHHLSRHRLAKVLGTSISTIRRLLNTETDLRKLALTEVGHRRRRGRYGHPPGEGFEAGLWLLRRMIPDSPNRIAEELVWWRVTLAAPTAARVPLDEAHLEEGPLHHRFAIANFGFVPMDVLQLDIEPRTPAVAADGAIDPVVSARAERDDVVAAEVAVALDLAAPTLEGERLARAAALVHALLEGVGVATCLGRVAPEEAVEILRSQLAFLAQVAEPELT